MVVNIFTFEFVVEKVSGEDELCQELWRLCAGPLVDVPKNEERVYYFPQGHMEQVCIFFTSFCLKFGFISVA